MSQDDDATIERVARAIYPLFASFVTGRGHTYEYDQTLEDNREAARELARAALSALPERELLAEALSALEPFAAQTRARGPTEERNIRRARAAADKIRAALTQEKQT